MISLNSKPINLSTREVIQSISYVSSTASNLSSAVDSDDDFIISNSTGELFHVSKKTGKFVQNEIKINLQDGDVITCIDRQMLMSQAKGIQQGDNLLFGSLKGLLYLFSSNWSRLDRVLEAHKGCVLCAKWLPDGNSFASSGEDGCLKIWVKPGNLRIVLAQLQNPIPSFSVFSNSTIAYSHDKFISISSLDRQKSDQELMNWKAHESLVLGIDCSGLRLASFGDDSKFKVWDHVGRIIYSSTALKNQPSSVSWSKNGKFFVVGASNKITVCDNNGATLSSLYFDHGSVLSIQWNLSSLEFLYTCMDGSFFTSAISNVTLEYKNFEVELNENGIVAFHDILNKSSEKLDVKSSIIHYSFEFERLVLVTATRIYCFFVRSLSTPMIVDIPSGFNINFIKLSSTYFVTCGINGIIMYYYDNRSVVNLRNAGLKLEHLTTSQLSVSPDSLVIVDRNAIYLYDPSNGRAIGDQPYLSHSSEIVAIQLEQTPANQLGRSRMLAFIDDLQDLNISIVSAASKVIQKESETCKVLKKLVESFLWNQENSYISYVSEGMLHVNHEPYALFVDADLIPLVTANSGDSVSSLEEAEIFEVGESDISKRISVEANIVECDYISFNGTRLVLKRFDGAMVEVAGLRVYPEILRVMVIKQKEGEKAVKMNRMVNDRMCWACLAVLSIQSNDLDTSEVCYAMLEETSKVSYINKIKEMTQEQKASGMNILKRRYKEAENQLVGSGKILEAVMMWIDLCQWEKGLELAKKYQRYTEVSHSESKKSFDLLYLMESVALMQPGQDADIEVSWEDQNRINVFSRLNSKYIECEMSAMRLKKEIEAVEDAENELELVLLDDEEGEEDGDISAEEQDGNKSKKFENGIPIRMGDCFVQFGLEESKEYLERMKKKLNKDQDDIGKKMSAMEKEMNELKVLLYKRFGDSIQLERNA